MTTRGIDIRQATGQIVFRASLKDSSGDKVVSGTTELRLLRAEDDGTLDVYDWTTNDFVATGSGTPDDETTMTHQQRRDSTGADVDTGIWTKVLSTLTNFAAGQVYIAQITNTGAAPESQEREFQFGGGVAANVVEISDDATAADNLELQFDGTGYTDDTAPSSRAQVGGLGAATGGSVNIEATSDNTGGAIIDGVTFVGSVQEATTFANTQSLDGILHDIDDAGDDIDIVYGFNVGGGRLATAVIFAGFVQSFSDEMKIKAYDHVGSDWEIIGTVSGTNSTTNSVITSPLLLKHTGTGAELGNVYIRFDTDSTTPANLSVDQLIVSAVNVGTTVGYANGQVWIDTVSGVAGTESFVNGVADNPVSTIASALTIASAVNLRKFWVGNGSTITLSATLANKVMEGHEWTLELGGQNVASSMFIDAAVSGTGTGSEAEFEDCIFAITSLPPMQAYNCSFTATTSGGFTLSTAGDYRFVNCQSGVPGTGAPLFTFGAGAITAEFRRWSGGITFAGITADDVITIGGELGTIDLGSPSGAADIQIRGTYKAIINVGSAVVNVTGAILAADVAAILVDTGTTLDGKLNTAQADLDLLTGADGVILATTQANYAPAVAGDQMDLVNAPNATALTAIGTAVWATTTRTLSSFGTLVADTATAVWGAATRTLSAFGFNVTLSDGSLSSAKFDESTAFPLKAADTGSTLISRTGADGDTLETLSDQIDGISAGGDATAANQTQILSDIADVQTAVDALSVSSGSGAFTLTITVDDGVDPLQNATVRLVEGATNLSGLTNVSGQIAFSVDAATYAVTITKNGYQFTPTTKAVSGTGSQTYSMTLTSITASPVGTVTGYFTALSEVGVAESGVTFTLRQSGVGGAARAGYDSTSRSTTSAVTTGLVQFVGMVPGAYYGLKRGTGEELIFKVPLDATSPWLMDSVLGAP